MPLGFAVDTYSYGCYVHPNQTFYLPNSSSPLAARKQSAPIGPYHLPVTSSVYNHQYGWGSLHPMPLNYNEGSCWTLALLRYQLILQYQEIKHSLPKLSKSQGFLKLFLTREHHQEANLKKLDSFLNCLIRNSPKNNLKSNIIRAFLRTEPMVVGAHQTPLTPATGLAQPPAVTTPKQTYTPDSRLPYEAMLRPPPSTYPRAACSPAPPNSAPIEKKTPQLILQSQSPINPWARHHQTTSDSSSSFGLSQLYLISSILSSPTITPSTSTSRSIFMWWPKSIGISLPARKAQNHPPALSTTSSFLYNPSSTYNCGETFEGQQNNFGLPIPKPSSGNANGLKSSSLILKVIHLEFKSNFTLAIQMGLFSLNKIKSTIQNKLKLAAEIKLPLNWKIRLTMINQREFLRQGQIGEEKGINQVEDDGLMLELIFRELQDSEIKKNNS
ncbi:hypothetical protein H4Q26_012720 [Puccinia striiformis f. sp. tritici PST-130]|nr:hypothetical protein H4Q26_012720 [Puccinia striiformis f. sp. tritici PST-130]